MSTVNISHPQYTAMANKWQRCRDCVSGQDAIHAAGETYLPRLTDQSDDDYKAYVTRAQFFNATWRTISALNGMIFRKAPVVEVPDAVEPLLDDITTGGIDFSIFSQGVTLDILTTGRIGVLVDYPPQGTNGMTLAEAQSLNLRPSLQMYKAETIINWKTARISNKTMLSQVVMSESVEVAADNEFEIKTETHYRVLDLVDGFYRVRIFAIDEKKNDVLLSESFPTMNGAKIPYIPFYFIGVDDTSATMDEPPLIDLVDANIAHYRMDADHKHGLHFTGLPTPVISGYTPENSSEKLYVGSSSAWVFPDPNAKANYLEYTGQGLGAIAEEKAKLENIMAILGARLLVSEKKDAETAQAAMIHRAGESSILSAIAKTISTGLTNALKTLTEWAGSDSEDVVVTLNSDFFPAELTPQELAALLQGWQMGAPGLSDAGLFTILKQRGLVNDEVELEDEQERIASKPIMRPNEEI